jgi:hypothetical protein
MSDLNSAIVEYVREAALSDRYAAYLRNTLVELAGIDAGSQGADAASRKQLPFDFMVSEVRAILGDVARIETIAAHPNAVEHRELTVQVPRSVDVAAVMHARAGAGSPQFVPRPVGERMFGRGVCRNEGQAAVLLAQMKLMRETAERVGRSPLHACVYRFASGAEWRNGEWRQDAGLPVLALDSTDRIPCSGQHGLVQYRCRLTPPEGTPFSVAELFPLVVLGLEKEGQNIGKEAVGGMFGSDRVRANVGVLGGFGSEVVAACDHVAIEIEVYASAKPERIAMLVTQLLDAAIVQYVEKYGDKTRELDPATGQAMLDRHFAVDLRATAEASIVRIDVWGRAGHMAATAGDNAITKAAFLLGALLRMAPKYPNVRVIARLADEERSVGAIVLAGAQSFALPLTAGDLERRLRAAATNGLRKYSQLRGCRFDPGMIEMTFDDANSEANAGMLDSMPMQALRQAFDALHEPWPEPTAWLGDGDAMYYHSRGNPVATFGAGKLDAAYGSNEHIDIPDLQKALAISTLAAWWLSR